tara:strand:- start:1580 stop:1975 length:396 start_codon:yes stop_codon:yes gene_type:complete
MDAEVISGLMDLGLAGFFIVYLVTNNKAAQKRLDESQKNAEERIDALRAETETIREKTRDRYMAVISKYDDQIEKYSDERGELRQKIDRDLSEIKEVTQKNGISIARLQEQISMLLAARNARKTNARKSSV